MTEEQLAQLGIDAEVLLNTEAFNRTINILVDASVQEFLGTASAKQISVKWHTAITKHWPISSTL